MPGVVPLALLHHVPGVREARRQRPVRPPGREPADVIEVQVAGDHDIDVRRRQPGIRQRVIQVIRAVEPVEVGELGIELVATARVNQDGLVAPDQQGPHAQGNAVPVVGRQALLPQRARHRAEHGAAVEREEPIRQRCQLEAAQGVGLRRHEAGHAVRGLLELHQHAMRLGRVNEGHERALRTGPRRPVDQPDAPRREVRQRSVDVLHPQRHVVQPGPALVDERRNGRIAGRGLDQFQRRRSGVDKRRPHALGGDLLGRLEVQAQVFQEEGQRRGQVADGDADVIEDGSHGVLRS